MLDGCVSSIVFVVWWGKGGMKYREQPEETPCTPDDHTGQNLRYGPVEEVR